jgi:hypothetical protein
MLGSNEVVMSLKIAVGSTAELETQLSICKGLEYCGKEYFLSPMLYREM